MPRLRATHPAAVALVVSLLVAGVAAAQGVAAPAPSPAAATPAAAVEGAVADSAGGLPPRPDAATDRVPLLGQIAMLRAPFFFASRSAANVSAVSPDWVMTTASVFLDTPRST